MREFIREYWECLGEPRELEVCLPVAGCSLGKPLAGMAACFGGVPYQKRAEGGHSSAFRAPLS